VYQQDAQLRTLSLAVIADMTTLGNPKTRDLLLAQVTGFEVDHH
jgi:hypothetical protein